MKKFIAKFFLFVLPIVLVTGVAIVLVNKKITRGNYFQIDSATKYIFLGHSHAAHAFNDSLIRQSVNISQDGESYFYTYYKLKKILDNNPQVQAVFIEFSNNQASKEMDKWIWGKEYIDYRLPKYGPFMDNEGWRLLFLKNYHPVLSSVSITFKKNVLFLLGQKKSYIREETWGGYLYSAIDKTDSLLQINKKNPGGKSPADTLTSSQSISYLQKCLDVCNEKKVKAYLMRSPMHPECVLRVNESKFREVLASEFTGVPFLDFKDFPLNNHDYLDLQHLNYKGANNFSLFFNELLQKGLLEQSDKQAFIDLAMQSWASQKK